MKKLNLALEHLCQNFGGEWLLLGGSLIRFDVDPSRGTEDIDLVRLDTNSTEQQTALIHEMKKMGISPEQMNSSVSFFLDQIENWQKEIVLLTSGSKGKIYRPTLTLFAILKLRRGTPVDLNDIKLAAEKWGPQEFNKDLFYSWATLKEVSLAQSLGLVSSL